MLWCKEETSGFAFMRPYVSHLPAQLDREGHIELPDMLNLSHIPSKRNLKPEGGVKLVKDQQRCPWYALESKALNSFPPWHC